MAEKYPLLNEMGVTNPEEISRYSLQTVNNVDILRIVYKRKKGSLLPTSKKYRFPRNPKMLVTDSGSQKTELIQEISPFLNKVTDELHTIISKKHMHKEQKEIILHEINRLEEETISRITYLRELVEKLD